MVNYDISKVFGALPEVIKGLPMTCLLYTSIDRSLSISHQGNGRKEMIQLENVHKSYGQTKVLKGIDLQIQDQDDVVILGPSGSGKSTLLNVLSGLEKVDEGHILIQGQDLSHLTDAQLTAFRREKIAFIFQQYYLLPNLTVRQNVKMGADPVSYTHLDVYKRQIFINQRPSVPFFCHSF